MARSGLPSPRSWARERTRCILHYPEHTIADPGGLDLVVVDIGAEYDRYAADVTRTYPADGRFSPEQRKIYDLVSRCRGVHRRGQAGRLLRGPPSQGRADVPRRRLSRRLHSWTRPWVGLEVHDAGDRGRALEPGMVLTIEPGLYLRDKGIGVRIEDDGPRHQDRPPRAHRGVAARCRCDRADDGGEVARLMTNPGAGTQPGGARIASDRDRIGELGLGSAGSSLWRASCGRDLQTRS